MTNYIYSPDNGNRGFSCRVPLEKTLQAFVVDGVAGKSDLTCLNSAEGVPGYAFHLGKGAVMEELLQIISIRSVADELDYCNTVTLERSANAKLLLCSHTLDEKRFTTEERLKIVLEENSALEIVIMQNEHNKSRHNTSFEITLEANASLRMHLITLHGGEISNNLEVNMNGKGAQTILNGLYLANGNQRISNRVNLSHNVPECYSRQLFKGILEDEAVTKFSGTIKVAKDAQKTEAYQANNNLLASEKAKAYTQPHLEIYADDVKCSHGATIGSLDANELFYMRSRGISLQEARILQQQAFAYAALEGITNEKLAERLNSLVECRLRGEFSHCQNCSTHCC